MKVIYPVYHLVYISFPRSKNVCGFASNSGADPGFREFANNTGADQPAHPRSLISAFVVGLMERILSRLASSKISIF